MLDQGIKTVPLHTWDSPASCQISTGFICPVMIFGFIKAMRYCFSFSISAAGFLLQKFRSKTLAEINSSNLKENGQLI